MDGQKKTPPLKPPKFHRQLRIPESNLMHSACINATGLNDQEPKEEELKGEKLAELGVGVWRYK